jgi:hypothetical protein
MYMFNGAIGTGLLVPRGQCVVAISNICDEGRTSNGSVFLFFKERAELRLRMIFWGFSGLIQKLDRQTALIE